MKNLLQFNARLQENRLLFFVTAIIARRMWIVLVSHTRDKAAIVIKQGIKLVTKKNVKKLIVRNHNIYVIWYTIYVVNQHLPRPVGTIVVVIWHPSARALYQCSRVFFEFMHDAHFQTQSFPDYHSDTWSHCCFALKKHLAKCVGVFVSLLSKLIIFQSIWSTSFFLARVRLMLVPRM